MGIVFEPAPAYTQHKNGISEQMIQKINTIVRAIMIDSRLPLPLWAEAVNTTICIHNRSPSKAITAIPNTLFNQKGAPLHHLRRFGCLANKLIPEEQQKVKKFGARSKECIMVGYVHDATNIWRIFDPENNSVKHNSDIIFDEMIIAVQPTGTANANELPDPFVGLNQESMEGVFFDAVPKITGSISAPTVRRSTRRKSMAEVACGIAASGCSILADDHLFLEDAPDSYNEAITSSCWRQAMQEEYSSLVENETWELSMLTAMYSAFKKAISSK